MGLFVIVPVSTYYLDPVDFGIIAIITVFSNFVLPFSTMAVGWVLGSSYYRLSESQRKEYIFNALLFGATLRVIFVSIFAVAGKYLLPVLIKSYESRFLVYYWIMLAGNLFACVWELVSYVIVLQKKGKYHALIEIIPFLFNLVTLVVLLAVFKLKTISLVIAVFVQAFTSCILATVYLRKLVTFKFSFYWLKQIAKLNIPSIPLNIFDFVSSYVERYFIEFWYSLSTLGIYSHSLLYRKMFMVPLKAFSRTYSPEVLESISTSNELMLSNAKIFLKRWFGVLSVFGIGVVLFSKEALTILTHGKFTQAAQLVSLWYILILVYSFGLPYTQFLFAHKKMKFVIISETTLGVFSWGMTWLFVKYCGINGAGLAIFLYIFALYIIRKHYSMSFGCPSFEDINFWIYLILVLGMVAFGIIALPIISKLVIFGALSFIFSYHFGLFSYLKKLKFVKNQRS